LRSGIERFLLLLPALGLFTFLVVVPFARGVVYSFTDWDGVSRTYNFVGLRNYLLLFSEAELVLPVKNTLIFTAITVVGVNALGLGIALLLNFEFRASGFFRSLFFFPIVMSLIMVSYIWSYLFSGFFAPVLGITGVLSNPKTVMLGISGIALWRDAGFAMVTYHAALVAVPGELLAAVKIDGASAFQRFRHVVFPLIAPAVTINVTLWLGWGLRVFDYVAAATRGGPGNASMTVAFQVYRMTFVYDKVGYGQAAAIVMMIVILALSITTTSLLRRREIEL
jgi:raffinose/stachyose/melibiose transport system permease protein